MGNLYPLSPIHGVCDRNQWQARVGGRVFSVVKRLPTGQVALGRPSESTGEAGWFPSCPPHPEVGVESFTDFTHTSRAGSVDCAWGDPMGPIGMCAPIRHVR
jgi:hypothetical protein